LGNQVLGVRIVRRISSTIWSSTTSEKSPRAVRRRVGSSRRMRCPLCLFVGGTPYSTQRFQ
jgi:hypothetical protein